MLLEQRQQLETTQQQLERLESLVTSRSEEGVVIESTLADQLVQLQSTQANANEAWNTDLTQLREEIAKQTNERQALQQLVQQLQQSLTAQSTRIQSLQDLPQPRDLSESVDDLLISFNQLQTEVTQLKTLRANENEAEVRQQIKTELEDLTTRQQRQAQILSQLTELQTVERQLTSRLDKLQSDLARSVTELSTATSTADYSSELAIIELSLAELREDIRAINNARQLINRDLLQLREQLNRIQLRIESP